MFTAAGLIGQQGSVIMQTALDVRGHAVVTAGAREWQQSLHFGRIKFRNKLTNWP